MACLAAAAKDRATRAMEAAAATGLVARVRARAGLREAALKEAAQVEPAAARAPATAAAVARAVKAEARTRCKRSRPDPT